MYVFKDFNRQHSKEIRWALVTDLSIIVVAWTSCALLVADMTVSLVLVLVCLGAAHTLRIARLVRSEQVRLTATQILVIVGLSACAIMLWSLAFLKVSVEAKISWTLYRWILLSIGLSAFTLIHVDYAVASLLSLLKK